MAKPGRPFGSGSKRRTPGLESRQSSLALSIVAPPIAARFRTGCDGARALLRHASEGSLNSFKIWPKESTQNALQFRLVHFTPTYKRRTTTYKRRTTTYKRRTTTRKARSVKSCASQTHHPPFRPIDFNQPLTNPKLERSNDRKPRLTARFPLFVGLDSMEAFEIKLIQEPFGWERWINDEAFRGGY